MNAALVVDDNQETTDALCRMVALLGLKCTPAYGARSALLAIQKEKPQVIFLDLSMPGLSGFEVLKFLQRDPELISIPVVIVSSADQTQVKRQAYKGGAAAYLTKPVEIGQMERVLAMLGLIQPPTE